MTDFDEYLQEQLQDPDFRKEYEALEQEANAFTFHKAASVETGAAFFYHPRHQIRIGFGRSYSRSIYLIA